MKEIALMGMNSPVLADILSALLHRNMAVNAMVTNPEHLMIDNTLLTVSHVDGKSVDTMAEDLEGYHDAVMAFGDDFTNAESNEFTLHAFPNMVTAARRAGVSRIIVVGSPQSAAFFLGDLRRQDDIDWVYISTEGDFARHAADEVETPRHHREEYMA